MKKIIYSVSCHERGTEPHPKFVLTAKQATNLADKHTYRLQSDGYRVEPDGCHGSWASYTEMATGLLAKEDEMFWYTWTLDRRYEFHADDTRTELSPPYDRMIVELKSYECHERRV